MTSSSFFLSLASATAAEASFWGSLAFSAGVAGGFAVSDDVPNLKLPLPLAADGAAAVVDDDPNLKPDEVIVLSDDVDDPNLNPEDPRDEEAVDDSFFFAPGLRASQQGQLSWLMSFDAKHSLQKVERYVIKGCPEMTTLF